MPLDALVPDNMKQKIRNDIFIDLYMLLNPTQESQSNTLSRSEDVKPSVSVKEAGAKRIYQIDQWVKAMHIYGSVDL